MNAQQILFYTGCVVWFAAVMWLLISAIRICYTIEARSGRQFLKGLPGYANIIPTAFNIGVENDNETQNLRWQMNKRLIAILALFAVFYGWLVIMKNGVT